MYVCVCMYVCIYVCMYVQRSNFSSKAVGKIIAEAEAKKTLFMLLTTESRSARGASRHPAFMDGSLTVSQTRLPCPPFGKMRLQVLDCGDGNK